MAEAKMDADWDRTAYSACLLANIHKDDKKKKSPYQPWQFHPRGRDRKPKDEVIEADITALKVFVDGKLPVEAMR